MFRSPYQTKAVEPVQPVETAQPTRFAEAETKSFQLVRVRPKGRPIAKNLDAKRYIERARKNPLVQAVENTILTDVSNVDWSRLYIGKEDTGEPDESKLAKAWNARLNTKTNYLQPASTWRYQLMSRVLTTGEAYATIHGSDTDILAIQPVLEGDLRPVPAEPGFQTPTGEPALISGYAAFNGNGRQVGPILPLDKVLRVYLPDEDDPFRAVSPLESAGLPANVVMAALELQLDVLDNHGAAPALVLTENADDDELSAAEARWQETATDPTKRGAIRFMGVHGRSTIIPGPSAQDIGKLASWQEATNLVMACYRVPKSAMGLVTGDTYANAQIGLRDYVERCVAFWLGLLASAVTQLLPPGLRCFVDLSNHPGMQEDQDQRAARFDRAYNSGAIYTNEYRAELGLEALPEDENTLGPVRTYTPLITPKEEVEEDPSEGKAVGPEEARTKAADRVLELWEDYIEDSTASLEGDVFDYLQRQERAVLGALEDAWAETAVTRSLTLAEKDTRQKNLATDAAVGLIVDRVFNLERWNKELAEDAPRWFRPITGRLTRYLLRAFGLDVDPRSLRSVAEARASKIVEINDSTREMVRLHILRSYTSGESIQKLKKRLAPVFGQHRALTIARTETLTISNNATYLAYEQRGIGRHEWLSANDERVRPGHRIHGEIREIGTPFSNGLLHPHDPNAPADQVINCRCTTAPVVDLPEI